MLVYKLGTRGPKRVRGAEGAVTTELPLTLADPRPEPASESTITHEQPLTTEPYPDPSSCDRTITYELPPMSDGNGPELRSPNVQVLPQEVTCELDSMSIGIPELILLNPAPGVYFEIHAPTKPDDGIPTVRRLML